MEEKLQVEQLDSQAGLGCLTAYVKLTTAAHHTATYLSDEEDPRAYKTPKPHLIIAT